MPAYLWLAVVVLLAACAPQRKLDTPLPAVDDTRFVHAQPRHAAIACSECHRGGARPGGDAHKPCSDAACHASAFAGAPTRLCETCHLRAAALATAGSPARSAPAAPAAPLRPFPLLDAWQSEPSRFSHKRHLNAATVEARVGFHVSCTDCHTRGDAGLSRPDHAACARCHADEVGLVRAPRMTECRACHEPATRLRTRARLIQGDLQFDHARHRSDRRGQAIRCDECHTRSEASDEYRDHAAPRVESCVGCHDDSDRTPPALSMRSCEACHREQRESLTAIAPRSHLPLTERPLDHTLAFRRDHAEAAERSATRCAACHTQMSGNPRQACDECHQTLRPADHQITWRELDHGREAAADRERCARCHVPELCTACHSQRPRSHGFASAFWTEHGRSARIDPRPCVTCHGESFCAQCHTTTPPQGRR